MKNCIAFVVLFCLTLVPLQAQDYVLTEILIKSHKELSNKLKNRIPIESSTLGTHYLIEESEKKYEAVTDTLSNRMASGITDFYLIPEVARLTQDAIDAVNIAEATYDKAGDMLLTHPIVMDVMLELNSGMADRITEIYRLIAMLVTNGIRVSLGTPEQRYMFLTIIDEKICWIRDNMLSFFRFLCTIENAGWNGTYDMLNRNEEEIYRTRLRHIDKMFENF